MPANFTGFDSANLYTSPEGVIIGLKGIDKRLKIFFADSSGVAYDPATVSVIVEDDSENVIVQGDYAGGFVKKENNGIYYINTSETLPLYNLISSAPKRYILKWQYKDVALGESALALSYFYIITTRAQLWVPRLRNEIDKALKIAGCGRVGYTDGNVYYYLLGGLDEINKFPPVTNFILENFPERYGQLLVDSAAIVALTSQSLFSIDTDVGAYSDQGFSFTIDHFSRLNTAMGGLLTKVKDQLRMLKMEFSGIGSIRVQMTPSYPLVVLLRTAPGGSLFRNLFVSS